MCENVAIDPPCRPPLADAYWYYFIRVDSGCYVDQRWKHVGSGFFDRPVKPVETPVKFSFLETKRHHSTDRNITINETFQKKQFSQTTPFENTC